MNDTSPEFSKLYRDKLLSKSGFERMEIASSMFDSAKTMVLASMPEGLTENEVNVFLLKRFYENDFEIDKFNEIVEYFSSQKV